MISKESTCREYETFRQNMGPVNEKKSLASQPLASKRIVRRITKFVALILS